MDEVGGNCAAALYAAGLPHIWIVRALVGELGLSYREAEQAALHARRVARAQRAAAENASCARSNSSAAAAGIGRANRNP